MDGNIKVARFVLENPQKTRNWHKIG
jgi:hypothetical protein